LKNTKGGGHGRSTRTLKSQLTTADQGITADDANFGRQERGKTLGNVEAQEVDALMVVIFDRSKGKIRREKGEIGGQVLLLKKKGECAQGGDWVLFE